MKEISKNLYEKLLVAESKEEVACLLEKEEITDPTADEVWEQIQEYSQDQTEAAELSMDELEDVVGGGKFPRKKRSWYNVGCAATVEIGSNCWGTDGGCVTCNICYDDHPNINCPKCGRQAYSNNSAANGHIYCRNCGEFEGSTV